MTLKHILLIFTIVITTACGVKSQILNDDSIKIPKNCKHFYINKISSCVKDSRGVWHCARPGQKICDKYFK